MGRGEIQRPPLVIVANTIIFIYSSVVITLLGTHVAPPSALDCGLRERWQSMFKEKSSEIKKIQDAFDCCGLMNSRDMAYPFPGKGHDAHACEQAFGRNKGCFPAWKAEEQQVAGILMAVVGMVFIWQVHISHTRYHIVTAHQYTVSHNRYPNSERVLAAPRRARSYLTHDC